MTSKTWKKLSAIFMVFAIVLCFSGCIRYKTTAKFYKDGTVDITILYATVDMSAYSDGEDDDADSLEEQMEAMEDLDWEVKEYNGEKGDDQDYIGFTMTKKGIDIEDLEDELKDTDLGFEKFSIEIDDDDMYILDWDVSGNTAETSSYGDEDDFEEYGGYMKFILELPNECEDENSTDNDGTTYEWNFFEMDEPIHAEFYVEGDFSKGFPTWIIFVIIGVVVVAAAVVVILLLKKKNGGNNGGAPVPPQTDYASTFSQVPQAPVAPAQFAPQAPVAPVVPEAPAQFVPQAPVAPVVPEAPVAPAAPVVPETPAFPDPTAPQDPNAGSGL